MESSGILGKHRLASSGHNLFVIGGTVMRTGFREALCFTLHGSCSAESSLCEDPTDALMLTRGQRATVRTAGLLNPFNVALSDVGSLDLLYWAACLFAANVKVG